VWGRTRSGQSAAVADAQAQAFDYEAARTSLAAQIAKAWFALGEANAQIGLAEASVEVRAKTAQSFEERFAEALIEEGGNASQLRLAQTELASSRATRAFWRGERERALRQIELLVGRYPAGQPFTTRGLPALPPPPPAGLPSELLLRRPDILAAERRLAAAGERSKAARLAKYPSFALTGSTGTTADSLHEVLDSANGVWSLAGGVLQPILTGGRLREEEAIAKTDEQKRQPDRRARPHHHLDVLQQAEHHHPGYAHNQFQPRGRSPALHAGGALYLASSIMLPEGLLSARRVEHPIGRQTNDVGSNPTCTYDCVQSSWQWTK
jgi:outer membrane protein TolC